MCRRTETAKEEEKGEGSRGKERERKRERQESRTVFVTAGFRPLHQVNGQRLDSISADPHFYTVNTMEPRPWNQARLYDQIEFMAESIPFVVSESTSHKVVVRTPSVVTECH